MERLGSLLWSGVTLLALLGMLSSIAGPALAGPVVRITEPAHGQVVEGQILINVAYRTDSSQPITRLELLIDDAVVRQYALAAPRLEGSQSFTWDFTSAAGSRHSISARAIDAAGEVGSATINVTVTGATTVGASGQDRIPPVINIYYPAQGAELSGEVEIKADATDNVGVRYVFFYIDGKLHKMIMNAPPFVDLWDTARVADGPHVLQARAMDEAENASSSAEVTVFVRNHDMTTAQPAALAPDAGPAVAPPAVGTGQPTVIESQFATVQDERPTLMADGGSADDAQAARVGYVPAITGDRAAARTSPPRLLAALPAPTEVPSPGATIDDSVAAIDSLTTTDTPLAGPQLAAAEFEPRVTMPRLLPAESMHIVTPLPEGATVDRPCGPQLASAELPQRTTSPRTAIAAAPSIATVVAPGATPAALQPSLQVTPDPAAPIRTTVPVRSLVPAETLTLDTGELDNVVAPPAVRDDISGTTRIAVLPERATRAAIPADGRMTRPGDPLVAPVAAMSFEDVQVLFDNETLALLTGPEVRDGISLAPLREIFEHSDGVLYWYPVEKRVRAVRPGTELAIQIGDPAVRVNDEVRTLEIAPYIKQGRTMVPLQFIADTLNVTITFNAETGQICLTSNEF